MPEDRDFDGPQTRAGRSGRTAELLDDDSDEEEWDEEEEEDVSEDWSAATGWRQTGAAAAGLMFGLALGAGLALLFAPRAGDETRELLGERARQWRGRAEDRLDDWRDGLGRAGRRGRRRMRRGVTRGRWAAEDLLERAGW